MAVVTQIPTGDYTPLVVSSDFGSKIQKKPRKAFSLLDFTSVFCTISSLLNIPIVPVDVPPMRAIPNLFKIRFKLIVTMI